MSNLTVKLEGKEMQDYINKRKAKKENKIKTPQVTPDWETGIFIENGTIAIKKKKYGMDYLTSDLPKDEVNEDESLYTEGDCVLYQFYCGNFSQTIKRCFDNGVYWNDLENYISNKAHEYGMDRNEGDFFSWFDGSFFGEFGSQIERIKGGV